MSDLEAFAGWLDLADERLGGRAIATSDDFFADMHHLVKPGPARFDPATYTDRGKEMDGWESRRKRVPGHDWCIVRLGVAGRIVGVDVDTSHFLGNHPPFASLDAADTTDEEIATGAVTWTRVLPSTPLKRGSRNLAPITVHGVFTHVRLNIYPDGGVARLRVYGAPAPAAGEVTDLLSLAAGARPLACSDMFFSPMTNLLLPQPSTYMGQGWETRRSRPPGEDWIVLRLAGSGTIDGFLLDTSHFKGNFPDRAVVEGLWWPGAPPQALIGHPDWRPLTPVTRLRADHEHHLAVTDHGPVTHLRLRIFPDGGVARLRAYGRPSGPPEDAALARLAARADLADLLGKVCGSGRWVGAMMDLRPFGSRTELVGEAAEIFWHLDERDWKAAFAHHPALGARVAGWSAAEQAGTSGADPAVLEALAAGNHEYEQRFGHVFLLCATGVSAAGMLDALRDRLGNTVENELRIAAGEVVKINALRLLRLLEAPGA